MKIFWSWQSDTPGKIGRHFVRDALETAISELKQTPNIEDALRYADLDQDRKGVPGSPNLADTILSKIEYASLFVGDVTPVASVINSDKKVINSNVAIELGYAWRSLSDQRILMIMNSAYGSRADLPFDLQHKAGPILFALSETATSDEIKNVRKQLVSELKLAIREIAKITPQIMAEPFPEAQPVEDNPGIYFDRSEPVVNRGHQDRYFFPFKAVTYLRLIPSGSPKSLKKVEAEKLAGGEQHLRRFSVYESFGSNPKANGFGAIDYDCGSGNKIMSASQLFTTGEIWGFDGSVLNPEVDGLGIPTRLHEPLIARSLYDYVRFASNKLEFNPPYQVEIGMTNVKNYVLFMPYKIEWGPITQRHIIMRAELKSCDTGEIDALLLRFFEAVFDAACHSRPVHYNGFPGAEPGSLPCS